jgi:hypothetical protein
MPHGGLIAIGGTNPNSMSPPFVDVHEYSNAVAKSEGLASAFFFFSASLKNKDAFCPLLTNTHICAISGQKKEGEIEGGIGVLIFCHSFTLSELKF